MFFMHELWMFVLGMEFPQGMLWGSKPKFWPDIIVTTLQIEGVEHEMYDRVIWLVTLVL